MTGHTPPSWSQRLIPGCLHDGQDRLIADFRTRDFSTVEAMAHARLSGAAPDMLDALMLAESVLSAVDMRGISCGAELRAVRDAIAKAGAAP